MKLIIQSPQIKEPIIKFFRVKEISDQPIDLGNIEIVPDEAIEPAELPKLTVKTVDLNGQPIADASVKVWDRHGFYANGLKMSFEPISKRSNGEGVCEMGRLPKDFFSVDANHADENHSRCYTVISGSPGKFKQTNPPRSNVRLEQTKERLVVTIRMLDHIDFKFKVVDDETGLDIFWPEIDYQDEAGKWWNVAIIDGAGQHNFMPLSTSILRRPLRISAEGYQQKFLSLPNRDAENPPNEQTIKLKPVGKSKRVGGVGGLLPVDRANDQARL